MQEIINNPLTILVATLFVGLLVFRFQRQQKRKKEKYFGGSTNAHKSRRYLEIETLKNRIDKLEVDVAYMKDFTIKKEVENKKPSTPINQKVELKSDLVNLIKKGKYSKGKKFTENVIKAEIERKCSDVHSLSAEQYQKEYNKAYKRLWARKKYNQLK